MSTYPIRPIVPVDPDALRSAGERFNRAATALVKGLRVSALCIDARNYSRRPSTTEADVIRWAETTLRTGRERLDLTDHQVRLIALAYLEGWTGREVTA